MPGVGPVLRLQLIMFLLMATGMALRKRRLMDSRGRAALTELLINVVLPANIIGSFLVAVTREVLAAGAVLLIGLGVQVFSYLLGKALYRRMPEGQKGALQYATMCSNAGFMGNPVIEGLYGTTGLLYASVYLIPLRVFMWTAGLSCFTAADGKAALKKLALHPCIVAVYIGFFFMGTDLALPAFVSDTLGCLGNCTLPLSMVIIGHILAGTRLRTIFTSRAFLYCGVRLALIPLVVLGTCVLLGTDPLVMAVSVILSGMPAGSTTAILAEKYGGDGAYASQCVLEYRAFAGEHSGMDLRSGLGGGVYVKRWKRRKGERHVIA